jgi:hypothetical protein
MASTFTPNIKASEGISVSGDSLFQSQQNYFNKKSDYSTLYTNTIFKSKGLQMNIDLNAKKYETTHGHVKAI